MVTKAGADAPRVDGITLVVHDMSRALGFYRSLGFALPPAVDEGGFVSLTQDQKFRLALNTETIERTLHPDWRCPANGGRMALVLRCEDPGEVDRAFERAIAGGGTVVLEPFDAAWGARHGRLLDPDGNVVDLFAAIP
jgi:uncharacterized glyoxalase superfamily protein PhnB